jgi:ribosomal protein S18 acetylase RimI-like enzyme
MNLRIKPASGNDETDVVALWRDCGLLVRHNDPGVDFRFARGKENSEILVGTGDDGQIVGTVMVGHDGHRGWVYYVAADPKRRTQGIGRAMMQAAEKWLTERDVPKLQLMVRETNAQVIAFYERIGFETVPRTVLQKWLKPSN